MAVGAAWPILVSVIVLVQIASALIQIFMVSIHSRRNPKWSRRPRLSESEPGHANEKKNKNHTAQSANLNLDVSATLCAVKRRQRC